MEILLRKLMSARCEAMSIPSRRCYGKSCTGQCDLFQMALFEMNKIVARTVQTAIDEMHLYNTVAEYEEIIR